MPTKTLERFSNVYALDEMANQEPQEEQNVDQSSADQNELSGLHAKLFIGESGDRATWIVGSANATTAAFTKNVEFMITLHGDRYQIGIDRLLGQAGDDVSLLNLLQPFDPTKGSGLIDKDEQALDEFIFSIHSWLQQSCLSLFVSQDGPQTYSLSLLQEKGSPIPQKRRFDIKCWPITLPENDAKVIDLSTIPFECNFNEISLLAITAFMAFSVNVKIGRKNFTHNFMMRLPIVGLPEIRERSILASIIEDKEDFLRYLRLLLSNQEELDIQTLLETTNYHEEGRINQITWEDLDLPLLENLVRALSRSPVLTIDRIENLIGDLKSTEQGRALIPPEFDDLWQIIISARKEMNS